MFAGRRQAYLSERFGGTVVTYTFVSGWYHERTRFSAALMINGTAQAVTQQCGTLRQALRELEKLLQSP